MMPVVDTSETVEIRPADREDAEAISAIYARVVTGTAASFEEVAPDRDEIVRRMTSRPRLPWLVAVSDTAVVGYAFASRHRERAAYRWAADCSVYVAEGRRGSGIGRLLYERLIDEMRALGFVSLFAGIALPNVASVALHESCGFLPVGVFPNAGFKHGTWHDVGWWSLRLAPPPDDPDEPREWGIGG
jgi:L-amino acid N-acyltransferase YncA